MADKMPWDDLPQDTNQKFPWDDLPEDEEEQVMVAEEKPFSADQYLKPMGFLERMGVTAFDEDNVVYQQLSNDSAFANAEPSVQRRIYDQAIDAENQRIFQEQGGDATQTITDSEGNKQTYIVPTPEMRNIDRFLGERGGKIFRSGAGGVLQVPKAVAQSVEFAADAITGNETDYVKENFPTLPPESNLDAVGQEVISTMIGGASGLGLANSLSKAYNITPKMANYVAKQWSKVNRKGRSPAELRDAASNLVNTFILGTGANIGATATAPSGSEALVGDDLVEAIGLEADDNPNLSIFADNVAFSAGLGALVKLGRGAKSLLGKGTKGIKGLGSKTRDAEVGFMVVSELDPNLAGAPNEVIAERVRILGEVLRKNANFNAELLGSEDVALSTTTALREGVKEYVDRAYAWRKPLDPEGHEQFLERLAGDMVSKIADLRSRQLPKGTAVRQQESEFLEGMDAALTKTSDDLGGEVAVDRAAEGIANPVLGDVLTANRTVDAAKGQADTAASELYKAQSRNEITQKLIQAQRGNLLGSNKQQTDKLRQLTGPQLYSEWLSSKTMYDDAFATLPYKPLDVPRFTELVRQASTAIDSIDAVTLANQAASVPFKKLIDMAKGYAKDGSIEAVDSRLMNQDLSFTDVYTEIRPLLEARIKQLAADKMPFDKIKMLKDGIDEMAAEIDDDQFNQAMDLWKQHQNTWRSTAPLKDYDAAARQAVPSIGTGMDDAYNAGLVALDQAFDSGNPSYMESFVRAMQTAAPEGQNIPVELSEAWVGQAMNALTRQGATGARAPDRQMIVDAVQPYLTRLENVSPDVISRFNSVIEDLNVLESGLGQADQVLAKAQAVAAQVVEEAKDKAASKFIYQLAGKNPQVVGNADDAFGKIFNNPQAPTFLPEIMEAVNAAGPLAREGIQAAFLRNLREVLRVNKVVGVSGANPAGNVRSISPAQVGNILNDPSSPVLKSLNIVFSNDPERAAQVVRLLEIHDIAAGGQSMRGQVFGSNTSYDADLKKLMDRVVTLRYGVLNTQATITRNLLDALTKGKRKEIQEAAEATIGDIVAYPEEFARILDLVARGNEPGALSIMTAISARGVLVGLDDEIDPIDQQMMDLVPQ